LSNDNYNDKIYADALKFYSDDFEFIVESLGLPLVLYISRAIEAPATIYFLEDGIRKTSKSAVAKDIILYEIGSYAYSELCKKFDGGLVKFPSCKHVLRLMDSREGSRLLSLGVSSVKIAEKFNVSLATVKNWQKRFCNG